MENLQGKEWIRNFLGVMEGRNKEIINLKTIFDYQLG